MAFSFIKMPDGRKPAERLYFVTMDEAPYDPLQQVKMACAAGILWVQLRMKQVSDAVFLETARAAKKICDTYGSHLILNDRVEIAREVRPYGVHVGLEDMSVSEVRSLLGEDMLIGGTANTAEDILLHCQQGADYIGLGPYRYTATKKKLSPVLGLEGYQKIMTTLHSQQLSIPVIAIGGIRAEDLSGLLAAGIHGIAFSGLLIQAEDKKALVKTLQDSIQRSLTIKTTDYADDRG